MHGTTSRDEPHTLLLLWQPLLDSHKRETSGRSKDQCLHMNT
jgi:hypothetical protein